MENCPYCGGVLKHRDYVKRIVKHGYGEREEIQIERMKCQDCGKLKRMLPDSLVAFKHYDTSVIKDVTENGIDYTDPAYEDYPCEMTMKRWKRSHDKLSS